jgi:crossover junction endodeoxyribonuclease RuvC
MGISPRQFAQLRQRLDAPKRRPAAVFTTSEAGGQPRHHVILGIDPSLRGTGYGVIHVGRGRLEAVAHDVIRCPPAWERSRCLLKITEVVREVTRRLQPTVCVIESLFHAQNYQTALILGEARGASLVAAAEAGLAIYELAPRRVKQAVVGYGAAQKLAVAKMIQRMLALTELPPPDAADALALAVTFAQEQNHPALTPLKRL